MDIPLDVEVYCSDGPCGRSTAVVLNPTSREVTHFVVQTKGFFHDEYLVPVDLIVEQPGQEVKPTAQRIALRCTCEELAQCPPFEKTVYIGLDGSEVGAQDAAAAMSVSTYAYPNQEYLGPPTPPTIQEEQIPQGELSLHRGAIVEASDGHVGQVDELLISPEGGHITHLVLRTGHLWGKRDVTIPVSQIDRMEEDTVYLKLDKAAVGKLPGVPPPKR